MRTIAKFLLAVLSFAPVSVTAAPVSQTAGSNLTQYNGSLGSIMGNQWNRDTNPRANMQQPTAKADYDNCQAVILRCAKPKCSGGGCTDANVAKSIVSGCLNSNSVCKKQADSLLDPLAGQLVAASIADKNKQEAAAAAANAAAEQNNQAMQQQMTQMQQQMQQQMAQMQQQNSQQIASLQNALAESQQATANAVAEAAAAATAAAERANQPVSVNVPTVTAEDKITVQSGDKDIVEVMERGKISGQILTSMEGVDASLDKMKSVMREAFRYGKCNEVTGENCQAPKRVKKFRELANKFFEPYEALNKNLENALFTAQSVGVDLGNIYLFFSGACNRWQQYVCSGDYSNGLPRYHTSDICYDSKGNEVSCNSSDAVGSKTQLANCNSKTSMSIKSSQVKENQPCTNGQIIPPEALTECIGNKILDMTEDNVTDILQPVSNENGAVRVGCAQNFQLLGIRRAKTMDGKVKNGLDIDLLEKLINQSDNYVKFDATGYGSNKDLCEKNPVAKCYCGLGFRDVGDMTLNTLDSAISKLQISVGKKAMDEESCLSDWGTPQKCYDLNLDVPAYVNPLYALCDTHAWNAGFQDSSLGESSTTSGAYIENQQKMKKIIGLKTTFIAQQLYKQYSSIETVKKQLKIMLEKEVLKAQLKAARGSSDTTSDATDAKGEKIEFEDCAAQDAESALKCLRENYQKIKPLIEKNQMSTAVAKQVVADCKVFKAQLEALGQAFKWSNNKSDGNCPDDVRSDKSTILDSYARNITILSQKVSDNKAKNRGRNNSYYDEDY